MVQNQEYWMIRFLLLFVSWSIRNRWNISECIRIFYQIICLCLNKSNNLSKKFVVSDTFFWVYVQCTYVLVKALQACYKSKAVLYCANPLRGLLYFGHFEKDYCPKNLTQKLIRIKCESMPKKVFWNLRCFYILQTLLLNLHKRCKYQIEFVICFCFHFHQSPLYINPTTAHDI